MKNSPVASLSQAQELAEKNPEALVDQISSLLHERKVLKHERNVLRCLLDEIISLSLENGESATQLLSKVRVIAGKPMVELRNAKGG